MIFIIRALSHVSKRVMETMIPPQVGMRLRTKKKESKEAQIKKEKRGHKKEKAQKNERKREKGQCYYPFTTLVL